MVTETLDDLSAQILEVGRGRGLAGVGICNAEPFRETATTLRRRLADGTSGNLTFTYRDPERATDVRRTFPWAQRLVVGAAAYLPSAGGPGPAAPGTARIARFAVEDYYPRVRRPLEEIAETLRIRSFRAEVLVDDNRLVDRAAAVRAGVGWWGKNTMVLMPGVGPWFLLGSVVTDARLQTTPPMRRDCGTCSACIPACPTGALTGPGELDARKCLAYWAQTEGVIPRDLRAAMADRIYGCDDCLDACPPGGKLADRSSREPRGRIDLVELLDASDDEILNRYRRFYIPRREPRFIRRNALVALGNSATSAHVPVLRRFVNHSDWVLRIHAAWALGRVGHPDAEQALRERSTREGDPRVLDEIRLALGVE